MSFRISQSQSINVQKSIKSSPSASGIDPAHPPTSDDLMKMFDSNGEEGLQIDEFQNMLRFLHLADGLDEDAFSRMTSEEFFSADSDHDGQVSKDEFEIYYWARLRFYFPVNPGKWNAQSGEQSDAREFRDLWNYFVGYASRGHPVRKEKMGCVGFLRVVKACGLLRPPRLTEANATICFLEAWAKLLNEDINVKEIPVSIAKKRTVQLDYRQFLFALKHVAQKLGKPLDKVIQIVLDTPPPKIPSSSMDFVVMSVDDYVCPGGEAGQFVDVASLPVGPESPAGRRMRSVAESVRLSSMGGLGENPAAPSYDPHPRLPPTAEESMESVGGGGGKKKPPQAPNQNQNPNPNPAQALQPGPFGGQPGLPEPTPSASVSVPSVRRGVGAGGGGAGGAASQSLTVGTLRDSLTYRGRSELGPVNLLPRLKDVFQRFCADVGSEGGLMSMEPVEFRKLLEAGKLFGGDVEQKTILSIYRNFATESLHFYQFLEALKMVAGFKRLSFNEVTERIIKDLHPQGLGFKAK